MGFLDLPSELRNEIYEQVLIKDGTIEIRHRHLFEVNLGYTRALTQVAKAIRSDCLTIYYANNIFLFRSIENCVCWLKVLGPDFSRLQHLWFAQGALEGAAWALSRPNTARHQVTVWARLFAQDGTAPTFSGLMSEDEIHETMKTNVENRLKPIEEATKNFVKVDAEISGVVHHCGHCASGACSVCRRSKCCLKFEDSDSE